jgi:hypothetical protein
MRFLILFSLPIFMLSGCVGPSQQFDATNPLTPKSISACSRPELNGKLINTLNSMVGEPNGPTSPISTAEIYFKNAAYDAVSVDGEVIDTGLGAALNCYGKFSFANGENDVGAVRLELRDPGQKNVLSVLLDNKEPTIPLKITWYSSDRLKREEAKQNEIQAKQDENHEVGLRTMACSSYASNAFIIFNLKETGRSFQYVSDWASSQAYGPDGQSYKGSEGTETILLRTVGAAFYGEGLYGHNAGEFHDFTLKMCMAGKTF